MDLTTSSASSLARSEPYLWLHLTGIAALPLCLELCLVGLRASSSLPTGLVGLLVALAGVGPTVWMQWQRPFCIFSLVVLALKPEQLSETQRRILAQFKAPIGRIIAVGVAGLALLILRQLIQWTVWIRPVPVPGGSLGGLLLAIAGFLLANLVLQVPASVLPVLLTPDAKLMPPYPTAKILQDFTLIGLRVKQILPAISHPATPPAPSVAATPVAATPNPPVSPPVGLPVSPAVNPSGTPSMPVEAAQSAEAKQSAAGVPTAMPDRTMPDRTMPDRASSPLISIALPETPPAPQPLQAAASSEFQPDPPDPPIIQSLSDLLPPDQQPTSAPNERLQANLPQVSQTIITIITVAVTATAAKPAAGPALASDPLGESELVLVPFSEPNARNPNARNTVVRIL